MFEFIVPDKKPSHPCFQRGWISTEFETHLMNSAEVIAIHEVANFGFVRPRCKRGRGGQIFKYTKYFVEGFVHLFRLSK